MAIQHTGPLLPAEIDEALDGYDAGDGRVSSLFADLARRTDRLICGALLGPEIAQPFDPAPVCGSYLTAMVHAEVAKRQMQADWQRFAGNYGMPSLFILQKPVRPKWGQPGRGRRRKARLVARRLEQAKRELAREVRSMLADPGTFSVPFQGGGG